MPGNAKALFDAAPDDGAAQPQSAKALFDAAPGDTRAEPAPSPGNRVMGAIGKATGAVKDGINQGIMDIGQSYGLPQLLQKLIPPVPPEELESRRKAQQVPGILKKDSPDWLAALGAFVDAIPGSDQGQVMSPEHQERAARFAEENPWSKLGIGLAGGMAQPLPAGAPAVANDAPSGLGSALQRFGISQGRRAISGSGSISVAKPLGNDAVRAALDTGAIRPFGTVEGTAARLNATREGLGDLYGNIVRSLKEKGIQGPEVEALAEKYVAEGAAKGADSMNPAVPKIYNDAAEQIRSKPATDGRLDLERAENLKRSLQDQARSAYKQNQPGEVHGALKDTASIMRQAVEDEIATQSAKAGGETAAIGQQFVPVKQRLGNIIEASDTADIAAARAGRNRGTSLTDTIAATGGAAAGGAPGAVLGGVANKLWRTRGPSTMSWASYKAGGLVQKLGQMSLTEPGRLGRFAVPLANAMRRGPDALAVAHFSLSQDPDYQRMTREREAGNDGAAQ